MMENILIIDDDPATTRLLEVLLTREGYNIQTENISANAVQITKEFNPNLIILDLMMPGTDGMTVCKMIKKDPNISPIPVIMFSAVNEANLRKEAFEAGVSEYISKPIHPDELKQKIREWLKYTPTYDDDITEN
ncbi:MAG TPA: response regulator [Anaerolineales bacterium]|nr:response regulator [Anaerolineales bacterium]